MIFCKNTGKVYPNRFNVFNRNKNFSVNLSGRINYLIKRYENILAYNRNECHLAVVDRI